MRSQSRWLLRGVLLGLLTLAVAIGQAAPTATGAPRQQLGSVALYLPVLHAAGGRGGIAGTVYSSYGTVAGHTVTLFMYPGSGPATAVSTLVLGGDGVFNFVNAPALTGGQAYFVVYFRQGAGSPNLAWVDSRDFTTSTLNQAVDLGTLDATGLDLVSPAAGATVGMPSDFTWTRRPTTTDSYAWYISDPTGQMRSLVTDELGYVDRVTISYFETGSGYQINTEYLWGVFVYTPNGAIGGTSGRPIRFSNIQTGDLERATGWSWNANLRLDPLFVR